MSSYPIIDNEQQKQFEIRVGDDVAMLQYRIHDNLLYLMHTEVPESFEGKGIGSALAQHAFEVARSRNMKVKVYCAFVKKFLLRHKEYEAEVVN